MMEINWWVWAGLWVFAWAWQNVAHEVSHLWSGWRREGRRPLKLIPVPHRYQGRWYFARYESGPPTKPDAERQEHWRHSAPFRYALDQIAVAGGSMIGTVVLSRFPNIVGESMAQDMWNIMVWIVPLFVCPLGDAAWWLRGYLWRVPGTDGERWRATLRDR